MAQRHRITRCRFARCSSRTTSYFNGNSQIAINRPAMLPVPAQTCRRAAHHREAGGMKFACSELLANDRGAAVIELAIVAPGARALASSASSTSATPTARRLALEQGAQRAIEKIMQTTENATVESHAGERGHLPGQRREQRRHLQNDSDLGEQRDRDLAAGMHQQAERSTTQSTSTSGDLRRLALPHAAGTRARVRPGHSDRQIHADVPDPLRQLQQRDQYLPSFGDRGHEDVMRLRRQLARDNAVPPPSKWRSRSRS